MPVATNRELLSPGPTPNLPPWTELTTRELIDWLNVSFQTCYNWHARRSGPPRKMLPSRRAVYRLADVLHWIEGPGSPTPQERIRQYLALNEQEIALATWRGLPAGIGSAIRRGMAMLPEISSEELDRICSSMQSYKVLRTKHVANDSGYGGSSAHV